MKDTTILLLMVLMTLGCTAQKRGRGKSHYEDLSAFRPTVSLPVERQEVFKPFVERPEKRPVQYAVNDSLNAIMDSISQVLKMQHFIDGYKLQLYSGQNRGRALKVKAQFEQAFPDRHARVRYLQPKFTVTAGAYFSRLEAQKDLISVKQVIFTTMLVPGKISIR